MTSGTDALTADFAFAQRYELVFDHARQVYLVEDVYQRPVAFVPPGLGGVIRTRGNQWAIETERRTIGWALVARKLDDRAVVGSIRETLLPYSYNLSVGPDREYRVTENPFNGCWSVRDRGSRLVRFSEIWDPDRLAANGRWPAGTIKTLEAPPKPHPLGLMVLLTLEMIKAQAAIPRITTSAGG